MRIYLTGFMGSGKSTLGRELSGILAIPFLDLDDYIEERTGKTIPQIFAEEGERSFREKERDCLLEVSELENVVVATGGGTPCFFDNMNRLNQTGFCVFLDIETEELASRLIKSDIDRPLIKDKSPGELLGFIDDMMKKRRPFYEKATYIFKGKKILPEEIISGLGK